MSTEDDVPTPPPDPPDPPDLPTPPPPPLPEVEQESTDDILAAAPSIDEIIEAAEPVEDVLAAEPSVDELLGRDRDESPDEPPEDGEA